MTCSVIVPTKNRPEELRTFLASLWGQSRLPDQLVVIDQSHPNNVIEAEVLHMANKLKVSLAYIHDESIKGLVQAKAASLVYNQCDIISFFDDDIVLEENYIEAIENAFIEYPSIKGANGVILNAPAESRFKQLIFRITHIGLYKDNRQRVISSLNKMSYKPLALNTLSGGLSSWRKEVFEKISFDTKNLFHAYEDKEYSVRFNRKFPKGMFLIPSARLYHNHALQNRESLFRRTEKDVVEVLMIFKKSGNYSFLGIDLLALLLGLFSNAILLSIRYRNIVFMNAYFKGFLLGMKRKILK